MAMENETTKANMKLLITIDTECDNAWAKPKIITTQNARFLPRFQQLCDSFGFKPTYLVSYEMAVDDFFVEFAADVIKRKAGEIGVHPHAWNTPPIYNLTSDDMKYHPYLLEYPQNILRQKLRYLTNLLEDVFGVKMHSHRAGKWAINAMYAQILAELEFKVDCSVTPNIVWKSKKRSNGDPSCPVINYLGFPDYAYFLDANDISQPGNMPILEIPVTLISRYKGPLKKLYSLFPIGIISRGLNLIFGPPVMWFRPHPNNRKTLMEIAKTLVNLKSNYIMFMLHSSELMPNGSPYFKSQEDIERIYVTLYEVFNFLRMNSINSMTCYEYYNHVIV